MPRHAYSRDSQTYLSSCLLLRLIKLFKLEGLGGTRVEEEELAYLPTLQPHMLHHTDSLGAGGERNESEATLNVLKGELRYVSM